MANDAHPSQLPNSPETFPVTEHEWGTSVELTGNASRILEAHLGPAFIYGQDDAEELDDLKKIYLRYNANLKLGTGEYDDPYTIDYHDESLFESDPQYQIRAFVFDWDDTIKPTGHAWVAAHREVLDSYGVKVDTPDILKLFGNINFAETLGLDKFTKDGRQLTAREVFDEVAAIAREKILVEPIDPQIIAMLRQLQASGRKIGVFSMSPGDLLREVIAQNELEGVIEAVVSVDDVTRPKPDPEGVNKVLDKLGEEPNHAVMIGDSWKDVAAGKAAGTYTVKIWHPLHSRVQIDAIGDKIKAASKSNDWQNFDDYAESMSPTIIVHVAYAEDLYEPVKDAAGNTITYAGKKGATYQQLEPNYQPLVSVLTDPIKMEISARREHGEDIRKKWKEALWRGAFGGNFLTNLHD
jgi:pyrophosphatase PpaX